MRGSSAKCFDVSEEKIRRVAMENHLTTVEEITNFTKPAAVAEPAYQT